MSGPRRRWLVGAVVLGALVGLASTVVEIERATWTRPATDGAVVRVDYLGSECEDERWARASESDDAVTLTVWTFTRAGSCSDVGVTRRVEVTLDEPLGDRRLVDGAR